MAQTIIDNINSILNTKSELQSILVENGQEGGEVFSSYPEQFRSAIMVASASGMNEEQIIGYISSYLSAYSFIDQNTLSSNSYLTQHQDLSSYALKSEFNSYVSKTELSNQSYITMNDVSSCGYITSGDIPSVDLSSYVTYDFLSSQSYLTSIPNEYITQDELSANSYLTQHQDLSGYLLSPTVSGYTGQMKLYNDGFFEVTSSGQVRAKTFTYNSLNSWSAYTLINRDTLKNYVNGRLAGMFSYDSATGTLTITSLT